MTDGLPLKLISLRATNSWTEKLPPFGIFLMFLNAMIYIQPFPKRQILDSSKLKEFAENNFKFEEHGRNFSRRLEKEKLLVSSIFSFSHSVFERLVLQTCKNQGLFGKGLKAF